MAQKMLVHPGQRRNSHILLFLSFEPARRLTKKQHQFYMARTISPYVFVRIIQTISLLLITNTIPANDPSPTFLLSKFRWSTLRILKSLTFTSSNGPAPSLSLTDAAFSEVGFHCTGTEILARFHPSDFRYSPIGPDHFMALSISNWISTKVMSAQLTAIQKELELMMGPYDDVLAALAPPAPN